MEVILEKIQNRLFSILYDSINFYKNVCDQQIFNSSTFVSCTVRYLYFMKTPNSIGNLDYSWDDQYLDHSQIKRGFINQLRNKDFELTQVDFDHQSAVV